MLYKINTFDLKENGQTEVWGKLYNTPWDRLREKVDLAFPTTTEWKGKIQYFHTMKYY